MTTAPPAYAATREGPDACPTVTMNFLPSSRTLFCLCHCVNVGGACRPLCLGTRNGRFVVETKGAHSGSTDVLIFESNQSNSVFRFAWYQQGRVLEGLLFGRCQSTTLLTLTLVWNMGVICYSCIPATSTLLLSEYEIRTSCADNRCFR